MYEHRGIPSELVMGVCGRRPQRVEGRALAFLRLQPPSTGDFFDAAEPVVQFAVGGFDHDVVDAGFGVGGEAGFQGGFVLAVPGGSERDGIGVGDQGFEGEGFFGGDALEEEADGVGEGEAHGGEDGGCLGFGGFVDAGSDDAVLGDGGHSCRAML